MRLDARRHVECEDCRAGSLFRGDALRQLASISKRVPTVRGPIEEYKSFSPEPHAKMARNRSAMKETTFEPCKWSDLCEKLVLRSRISEGTLSAANKIAPQPAC